MPYNAPQYGVGGDFGTRFCPPLKMPERGHAAGPACRQAGAERITPLHLYCLLCAGYFFQIIGTL
jgi:hypothetical protein